MGESFPSFQTALLRVWAGKRYRSFLGPRQLGDPCPSFLRTTVMRGYTGRGDGRSERDSLKSWGRSGTTSPFQPCTGLSLDTHFFAWDSWARPTTVTCGQSVREAGRWEWLGSALTPWAPDPQSWWPRDLQPGVSSRAWRPYTLPVGTGKPLWLSWPFSSFSSFGSQATLGPH